jgi:hypothetical protein
MHQEVADTNSFKKPALKMARSFHQNDPSAFAPSSSANTSFNNNSVFSSQRTQATTANTSFTTDGADDEPPTDRSPRKSSTSLESMGGTKVIAVLSEAEREAFELEKQREADRIFSQGASRETNSTYGSIDEDFFLHAEHGTSRKSGSSLRPVEVVQAQVSPQPATVTPIKHPQVETPFLETPAPAQSHTKDSPSRVPWYIRDLPSSNLFVSDLPGELIACPYFLAFIGCRIASANNVALSDVLRITNTSNTRDDPSIFWSSIGGNLRTEPRESSDVWTAAKRSFEGYTFKGKVIFDRSGPVFRLKSLSIQTEKSCLFQRMFGSDRFLYLTFPSFQDKPDRFTQDQMPLVEAQWKLWILQSHSFLARKWRVFHIEPTKKKGNSRKTGDNASDTRVILFATEGAGIDRPMSSVK